MQKTDFEVVVIGAGPAGSYASRCLADRGHDVALVDENDGPRCTVICSGIVGREAFEALPLPKHSIVDTIRHARFISPTGITVPYAPPEPMAYVVDRTRFDSALTAAASEAGARVHWGHKARVIDRSLSGVTLTTNERGADRVLRTRAVIIATGYQRPFHDVLGLGAPERYVHGVHSELDFTQVDAAELYFGNEISRGFFAWVVPFGSGRARLGILSERNGHDLFGQFSQHSSIGSRLLPRIEGKNGRPTSRSRGIVQGFVQPSFADRALAVGEAAGQIKTTTGGGIYYGMIGAEIAADVLSSALRQNRLNSGYLRRYEHAWRNRLGSEIRAGLTLQRLGREMDDQAIDRLFEGLQDGVGTAIRQVARFDWHRPAVGLLCRHPKAGLALMKRILEVEA